MMRMATTIKSPLGADILVYTPREWDKALKDGDFFVKEIADNGKSDLWPVKITKHKYYFGVDSKSGRRFGFCERCFFRHGILRSCLRFSRAGRREVFKSCHYT